MVLGFANKGNFNLPNFKIILEVKIPLLKEYKYICPKNLAEKKFNGSTRFNLAFEVKSDDYFARKLQKSNLKPILTNSLDVM